MSITLSVGVTTAVLNPDLRWSDEDNWHGVQQSVVRTLTGALDVQAAAMVRGRSITLEPENDGCAWMTSDIVAQLRNWAAVPLQQMTLTIRGVPRTVIFRHQDGALEARPVTHFRDREEGDFYLCVIRLMEV